MHVLTSHVHPCTACMFVSICIHSILYTCTPRTCVYMHMRTNRHGTLYATVQVYSGFVLWPALYIQHIYVCIYDTCYAINIHSMRIHPWHSYADTSHMWRHGWSNTYIVYCCVHTHSMCLYMHTTHMCVAHVYAYSVILYAMDGWPITQALA